MNYRLNRLRNQKRRKPRITKKRLAVLIYIAGLFYGFCIASEDEYQHAKKQEQLVASFWAGDGSKHFSGSEE